MSQVHLDAYVIGNVDVMKQLEAWIQTRNKSGNTDAAADVFWLEGDVLHYPAEQAADLMAGIQTSIDTERSRIPLPGCFERKRNEMPSSG